MPVLDRQAACPQSIAMQKEHAIDTRPLASLHRDPLLYGLLVASLLTGVLLHYGLPAGYSQPWRQGLWPPLALLLLYPLVEEVLFRGLLQGELLRYGWARRRWSGVSLANGLTSIAFVLLHLVNQPVGWALAVLLPSLVLGFFRERYASVWPAIGLHGMFNAVWLLAGS